MRKTSKLLSALLAIAFVLTLSPVSVFAEDGNDGNDVYISNGQEAQAPGDNEDATDSQEPDEGTEEDLGQPDEGEGEDEDLTGEETEEPGEGDEDGNTGEETEAPGDEDEEGQEPEEEFPGMMANGIMDTFDTQAEEITDWEDAFSGLTRDGVYYFVLAGDLSATGAATIAVDNVTVHITGNDVTVTSGAFRHINVSGSNVSLIFDGVTLDGDTIGGGINVSGGGSFTLTEAKIENCYTSSQGAGLFAKNTKEISVIGSYFTGNVAHYDGGAIYTYDINLVNISGGEFSNNSSQNSSGGAIYIADDYFSTQFNTLQISNVKFDGNQVGPYSAGGAVHAKKTHVDISSSQFINNNAVGEGGALTLGENDSKNGNHTVAINISGSLFKGNEGSQGGAVRVQFAQSVNIADSEFYDNIASVDGGALSLENQHSGSVRISGGVFNNNHAVNGGAAKVAFVENVVINGVESFIGNIASNQGGAVIFYRDNNVEVSNSKFTSNNSDTAGGALAFYSPSTTNPNVNISGSSFEQNNAYAGGAIYIYTTSNAEVDISGSLFNQNNAVRYGGAVYVESGDYRQGTIEVTNTDFTDNRLAGLTSSAAEPWGGAFYAHYYHTVSIFDSTFTGNEADGDQVIKEGVTYDRSGKGGGVYVEGAHTLNIGSEFYDNKAYGKEYEAGAGGAIYAAGVYDTYVKESIFSKNYSAYKGGALYVRHSTNVYISNDCDFNNNVADADGGAVAIEFGVKYVEIKDSKFYENRAESNSGALNIFYVEEALLDNITVINNEAGNQGGGMCFEIKNPNAKIEVRNSRFNNNTAENSRAGGMFLNIYCDDPDDNKGVLNILNTEVIGNTSKWDGGGIMCCNAKLTVAGCKIEGNTTTHGNGGGIAIEKLTDGLFVGNYEDGSGTFGATTIYNNKAPNGDGGGIYAPYHNYKMDANGNLLDEDGNIASETGKDPVDLNSSKKLKNVYIYENVSFTGNTAVSFATKVNEEDINTHRDFVFATHFSNMPGTTEQFKYAYNNYDINYTEDRTPWYALRVNFVANGGVIEESKHDPDTNFGQTYTVYKYVDPTENLTEEEKIERMKLMEPSANREGYVFLGWYTEDNTTSPKWDFSVDYVQADMTLYAQWGKIVDVTYMSNYPAAAGIGNIYKVDARVNGFGYVFLNNDESGTNFGCEGYVFLEWNTKTDGTGISYAPGQTENLDTNLTVYAIWEEDGNGPGPNPGVEEFDVTYHANHTDDAAGSNIYTEVGGKGYIVFDAATAADHGIGRTGYVLTGWSDTATGTEKYALGEEVDVEQALHLYAIWEKDGTNPGPNPDDEFTVTYHANYAGSEATYSETGGAGYVLITRATAASHGISRGGYSLIGWSTVPGGNTIDHNLGAVIDVTEDLDLYAVWSRNGTITPPIDPTDPTDPDPTPGTTDPEPETDPDETVVIDEEEVPLGSGEETTDPVEEEEEPLFQIDDEEVPLGEGPGDADGTPEGRLPHTGLEDTKTGKAFFGLLLVMMTMAVTAAGVVLRRRKEEN